MAILRIAHRGKELQPENRIREENILGGDLEDKIATDPDLLGEPLLLIGRQVVLQDKNDRLDFLALDTKGNSVVIEIKRSLTQEALDITSLRYASYLSKWKLEDFENQTRKFLKKVGDPNFDFVAFFKSFCQGVGVKTIPKINQNQRVIVTGSIINDNLSRFAMWLRDRHIDVTVVELQMFKDEDTILIKPDFIVPANREEAFATEEVSETEASPSGEKGKDAQWKSWHLDKRCGPKTKGMCLKIDRIMDNNFDLDGPHWEQKSYISYQINHSEWLCIYTTPSILRLDFFVKAGTFLADDIARTLKIMKYDSEDATSDESGAESSVFIKPRDENTDRIQLRIKEDFDVESDGFLLFLEEAYRAFSG